MPVGVIAQETVEKNPLAMLSRVLPLLMSGAGAAKQGQEQKRAGHRQQLAALHDEAKAGADTGGSMVGKGNALDIAFNLLKMKKRMDISEEEEEEENEDMEMYGQDDWSQYRGEITPRERIVIKPTPSTTMTPTTEDIDEAQTGIPSPTSFFGWDTATLPVPPPSTPQEIESWNNMIQAAKWGRPVAPEEMKRRLIAMRERKKLEESEDYDPYADWDDIYD